ncbi:glycosyl transferase family protein, partial [Halteromyces radiatus]|uniref:glycosyl transferase family protein n=1 Tax=Halteromyces radiatus TaxID=101107 RepID=UPI00222065F0
AWITTLIGDDGYVKGVITLQYSLQHVLHSMYPLLVLYTSTTPPQVVHLLQSIGCRMKKVDNIQPPEPVQYSQERFRNTWTKLAAWDQDDYDRLVLIDADMLPIRNMDDIMTLPFPQDDWIAASPACTCNPQKITNYPHDWIPEKCAYTYTSKDDTSFQTTFFQRSSLHYFNSGLVVLKPRHAIFETMIKRLEVEPEIRHYIFPDQDLLNHQFRDHWTVLPYTFNALKPMVISHPSLWDLHRI